MEPRIIQLPERLNESKAILLLMVFQFIAITMLAFTVWDMATILNALESELIRLHHIGREMLKTPPPTFTTTVELTPKSSEK